MYGKCAEMIHTCTQYRVQSRIFIINFFSGGWGGHYGRMGNTWSYFYNFSTIALKNEGRGTVAIVWEIPGLLPSS